jgi:type III pantothenate kinase
MHCAVDIGNSFTKLFFTENNAVKKKLTISNSDHALIIESIEKIKPSKAIISSVIGIPAFYQTVLPFSIILDSNTPLPFAIDYQNRATLGADRIALAAAARFLYPNKNVLTIDAGTCITYDIITRENIFKGGSISPGIKMRFRALEHFTARLPLIDTFDIKSIPLTGNSTETSILSGVLNGVIHEMDGFIEQYKSLYKDLTVLITGGDADFFVLHLKNEIFADSNLQATGLNYILNHNQNAFEQ